jgi:hypothetical protein
MKVKIIEKSRTTSERAYIRVFSGFRRKHIWYVDRCLDFKQDDGSARFKYFQTRTGYSPSEMSLHTQSNLPS